MTQAVHQADLGSAFQSRLRRIQPIPSNVIFRLVLQMIPFWIWGSGHMDSIDSFLNRTITLATVLMGTDLHGCWVPESSTLGPTCGNGYVMNIIAKRAFAETSMWNLAFLP